MYEAYNAFLAYIYNNMKALKIKIKNSKKPVFALFK